MTLAVGTLRPAFTGRLNPAEVLAKIRGTVSDRRVSIRPAPDTMLRFSALQPLGPGIGAFFALRRCRPRAGRG